MNKHKWNYLFVFGWILFFPLTVAAHDMWLEKTDGGYLVAMGHKGEHDPYEPERVRQVIGYTKNAWPVELPVEQSKDGCKVFADEPFCALTAVLDNKYWFRSTEGWKNQRETKGFKILEEGRSFKYTKHISQWCDFLSKPLGQRIEIVPLKDPTSMQEGDHLPVKVIFEGKPLSIVNISESSAISDTHDLKEVRGEGPFSVIIGPPGPQLVNAKHRIEVEGKQVVWFACSLTFNVKK